MTNSRVLKLTVIVFLMAASVANVLVAAQDDADVQAKVENAISATPPAIGKDATVMDVNAEGELVVLREGTSEWTCFPDNPGSPGNDPICLDPVFMVWNDALMTGTEPDITTPGLAYMLQGGSDASNTDPFVMEPAKGEDWISTPPHVMIVFPDQLDPAIFSSDHSSGGPYVMWAGTPYEHIMMPVNLEEMEH
jgi:hypothetical protein